ncbi:MAG TPA: radical SAM protein [Acidobacteriota bacterium]|nr:radical SAM protein [Acidobacteriota bacterium]
MIIFLHPRATSTRSRRFPLSILALAAVVEGREDYAIVDGNVDPDPGSTLEGILRENPVELLAVSVMPGPQMVAAIPLCREFKTKHPSIPIVWGGYFASLYPDAALNAGYVDYVVRGQGEDTFTELIAAIRGSKDFCAICGLSYKEGSGRHIHNPDRPLRSPDDYPWYPYHRLDASKYILPTFLGSRTAVHQASIGCPFRCNFCGVVPVFDREKAESPERTAAILGFLRERLGVNAIQFYDNNFFLREDHTRELADRLIPHGLRWWCEGRIDTVLGYSDETLSALKRAGASMIFFGAESGSNWVLEQMNKKLKAEQTLALAERIRKFGITPEFSFVLGNPQDPERDVRESVSFIRKLKKINPSAEIIIQHYIPVPQRAGMYGKVEGQIQFPTTPEGWATERWYNFTIRKDPQLPWLPERIRRRIDSFELVVNSRWPTVQDIRLPAWGRALLKSLSSWRYSFGLYGRPLELKWVQRAMELRKPKVESL